MIYYFFSNLKSAIIYIFLAEAKEQILNNYKKFANFRFILFESSKLIVFNFLINFFFFVRVNPKYHLFWSYLFC
jgi:hypothetical protein